MRDIKSTFSAASAFPIKLLSNGELLRRIYEDRQIPPIHLQIFPTNRCNLNCSFCSCKEEDRETEIDFNRLEQAIFELGDLGGVKAVTITGGGEPLLYPRLLDLFDVLDAHFCDIGLVTNGLLLHKMDRRFFRSLVWCRISCADERPFIKLAKHFSELMTKYTIIDWAFSYVVGDNPNLKNIAHVVSFSNAISSVTHVRIVSDILKTVNPWKHKVKEYLFRQHISDHKVIYQDRNEYLPGDRHCYIGYLKPLISAEGKIYACCGAQYAIRGKERKMPDELCLGRIEDIRKIFEEQKPIDGSICHKCYYNGYNQLLSTLMDNRVYCHETFV